MKKIVVLLIIGLIFSSGACNKVFADMKIDENSSTIEQMESSANSHSEIECCDENNDKKIEILAVSSKSNSVKQNFTNIVEEFAFREHGTLANSYRTPPFRCSGIKQLTESIFLRE